MASRPSAQSRDFARSHRSSRVKFLRTLSHTHRRRGTLFRSLSTSYETNIDCVRCCALVPERDLARATTLRLHWSATGDVEAPVLQDRISRYRSEGRALWRTSRRLLELRPGLSRYAIIGRENCKSPAGAAPTDAEKLELFGGILAYAGTYTIEGDKLSPSASIFHGTRAGLAHRRQDQHGGGQRGTSGFSLDALRRSAGRFIEGATHDI